MAKIGPKFTLPEPSRQYKFVLTPLADAMFQLLIFFMLSSNLAPYALLTIRSGSQSDFANASGQSIASEAKQFGDVAIWNVSPDGLTIAGQSFGYESLPALTSAITDIETTILLIIRDSASVQDLTLVVEALTVAGISNVQITAQSI